MSYPIPERQPHLCPFCDLGSAAEHGHLWCRRKASRSRSEHPKFHYRKFTPAKGSQPAPEPPDYRGNGNPNGERA